MVDSCHVFFTVWSIFAEQMLLIAEVVRSFTVFCMLMVQCRGSHLHIRIKALLQSKVVVASDAEAAAVLCIAHACRDDFVSTGLRLEVPCIRYEESIR